MKFGIRKMKIDERFEKISYTNQSNLIDQISDLIMKKEPRLSKKAILQDIDVRNKLGEGLMSLTVLSMHIQDKLVQHDMVLYINLNRSFSYSSMTLHQKFNINKLVIIVVNPEHQLDHLSKLEDFIEN